MLLKMFFEIKGAHGKVALPWEPPKGVAIRDMFIYYTLNPI